MSPTKITKLVRKCLKGLTPEEREFIAKETNAEIYLENYLTCPRTFTTNEVFALLATIERIRGVKFLAIDDFTQASCFNKYARRRYAQAAAAASEKKTQDHIEAITLARENVDEVRVRIGSTPEDLHEALHKLDLAISAISGPGARRQLF